MDTFDAEARRNNVYPLVAPSARTAISSDADIPRIDFWSSHASLPATAGRFPNSRSFEMTAEFNLAKSEGAGGVAALASHFGGWSLFLEQGRPSFVYAASTNPKDIFRLNTKQRLSPGLKKLRLSFEIQRGGAAKATLFDDQTKLGALAIARLFRVPAGLGEQIDVGGDTGVPVTSYSRPLGELEGEIKHVWFTFP